MLNNVTERCPGKRDDRTVLISFSPKPLKFNVVMHNFNMHFDMYL